MPAPYRLYFIHLLSVLLLLQVAVPAMAGERTLLLATTTSTDNTGLLDYLGPMFAEATGIELKWVATGTGKALKLGENCDADVLMVHAPTEEQSYVAAGFGFNRRRIMSNDFVLIGPPADPAAIRYRQICTAFEAIRAENAPFASRGDNSGTNKMEISLWQQCARGIPEDEKWYLQTGQGMIATINVAAERGAYTLADRGTYIKYEANHNGIPPLDILVEGDPGLLNQYSVMEINPERCPQVKNDLARQFGDWLIGNQGQEAIAGFRLLDKQLFTPNAEK